MAKNTKQIALIQHRRGKLSELPKQLNEGEFGLALDTNEVFIGNSTNPALTERIESNTFPYGNIQVLTEFTDNLQKIIYRYKSNTDIKARLPIVIKGDAAYPSVPAEASIKINGIEVKFNTPKDYIVDIIKIINEALPPTTKAFTDDNISLSFISTEPSLTLEDGYIPSQQRGLVEIFGFGETSFTSVSSLPPERTLQERLDDTVSIKSFGALGDNSSNEDGDAIFNGIIALNKAGVDAKYYRTLFFPAGVYTTIKTLPLPYGTHIKGEGIKRTIIRGENLTTPLFVAMDGNMNLATSTDSYGLNTNSAGYVTIEDMTIDISDSYSTSILTLSACHNIVFKNVEFIGNGGSKSIIIEDAVNVSNSIHILFDSCIFKNSYLGIYSTSNVEHLVIKNCIFENILNSSIWLDPTENNTIINSIIEGNYFRNCGEDGAIIHLGERTQYISTINNRFDEENSTFEAAQSYETLSDKNYTDILDPSTDNRKLLQFNFTQPKWQYIDYLLTPNGDELVKAVYETEEIDGEIVIKPLTNGIILKQGEESNDNTVTIETSSKFGNMTITSGVYGSMDIGNGLGSSFEPEWENTTYNVGDIVQVTKNNEYSIYECIKKITSSDIEIRGEIKPENYSQYWRLIGTFNPIIYLNKPVDLTNNYIFASNGDITFKTTENNSKINKLVIDDKNNTSSYSYAERIALDKDAIPNVDYVNTVAQTTVMKKFDFSSINNLGTNKQEIVYFDPKIYGPFVNLNYVNLNVRRPFFPIISTISSALEWQSGLRYYQGDVVKTLTDDVTVSEFSIKSGNGTSWSNDFSNLFETVPVEKIEGTGLPARNYPDDSMDDKYGEFRDFNERNLFYKHKGIWYQFGSEDWKDLYPSKVEITPETVDYEQDSIFTITYKHTINGNSIYKDYEVNLPSPSSLENFVYDVQHATYKDDNNIEHNICEDLGISISLNGSTICIEQPNMDRCTLRLSDGRFSPLMSLGFEFDKETGYVIVKTAELLKSYDNVKTFDASNYILGSAWVKSTGKENWFTCIYDNIASDSFNIDLGNNGSIAKWINIVMLDVYDNPLKDLKYLCILAQSDNTVDDDTSELKENEQRLLFLKNIVEADRRDFHAVYEQPFDANHHYNKKDRCLYAGRYWECLEANTPATIASQKGYVSGEYILHHPDYWKAVPEEGFNYHFDFERDLYMIDENDNIVTADDVVIDYNFSNYHFFLMFYDKDGKRLVPYPVDYDTDGLNYKGSVLNESQLPTQGNQQDDYYIVGPEKYIFYWDVDVWKPLEPYTYLCISPAGNVIITINYLRTLGVDADED